MRTRTTVRTARLAAGGLSLGLALTLTACGSDDSKDDAAVETETSAPASESASSSAAAPAGDEVEVKIGKTFKDPDMGDTVEVISAVRDFPSTEEADLIADGGEVVLLQVKVKPGKEYGGSVSYSNFDISADGGSDFDSADSQLEEELTAANRTPLDSVRRMEGGETTGWIAYTVDEKGDTYLIEYERPGAKVIGSDKTIAEFKEQVEIPAG
ncbi:transcriptional regulator [Nocardioides sp.]|uniref:transcriptional regulator n=1 Tax=Nocardioides sp. TaxID=35761 RepID=UPI0025D2906E|nr:transcriptional regulator [Nocardioides sp.]